MTSTTPAVTLYGARHEDSALFSIAEVERVTEATAAADTGESSGFIDVGALAEPSPGRDEGPAASLLRMVTAPQRTRGPRKGGLYGVVAGLTLALLSSITAVAAPARERPQIDAATLAAFETELGDPASELLDEALDDRMIILAVDDEYEPEAEPEAEVATAPEPEPAPAPAPRKATKRSTKRSTKAPAKAQAKAPAKAPAEAPEADGPDPMSVECLLTPAKCKVPSSAPAPASKPSKPSVDRPEKLDAAAVKAGIAASKDAAEARCERYADAGDKVEVKLSVRGSTGAVILAEARGAAAGTALGTCVARELEASSFDRFTAPQQGMIVTVRF